MINFIIQTVVTFLGIIVPLLLSVAFLTLVERKILGAMQRRKGPNVVGFLGLLQPLADAVKLLAKETVIPSAGNKVIFVIAPGITFFLSLIGWAVIPFSPYNLVADIDLGVIYLFAISSLGVYGIVMSGWASNSKYAFLGALRSAAQMISYEVSIGLILISIVISVGSLNLLDIVMFQEHVWFIWPFFPLFLMFFISALAETNRPPFDLPEAEGELVAGYSVEYSAAGFVLFFIGEYANIILMSFLLPLFFLGGWLAPWPLSLILPEGLGFFWFTFKVLFCLFLFIWVRAAFPRYRYDQLMRLGWKILLPMSLGWVVFVASVLFAMDWLPPTK